MGYPTDIDTAVRDLCAAGRLDAATTRILEELGPEVYGFLCAMRSSEADAKDAFSLFSEQLWRSLPRFAGKCSVRSWAYLLARHALTDAARANAHRHEAVSLGFAEDIAAAVRTATRSWLRTERADKLRALREQLSPEEQILLVLRIDRGLEWNDVARALLPIEPEPSAKDLERESAKLRKRFETLRKRLRARSEELGLIPPGTHRT
ncbi:RNA polymerase sigma factor [Sorangium sp. So ce1078]|uniref:RNA polymerase sigma factor n=1 Tax=Sorangium sp. So ce1078 TaxID=3133329 RepID=UPI003F600B23